MGHFGSGVKILALFVRGQILVTHNQMLVYLYEGGIFYTWESYGIVWRGVFKTDKKVVWVIMKMLFLVRGVSKNYYFGRGVLKIPIPSPSYFEMEYI